MPGHGSSTSASTPRSGGRDWAGVTRRAATRCQLLQALPGLAASGAFRALVAVVETGEPLVCNAVSYEDQVPDGNLVSGTFDAQVVKHGDGFVAVWHDVSLREQARDSLVRTTELLRAIVDISPFATMAYDSRANLTFWNPAAERIFGWSTSEVIGKPFPAAGIHDDDVRSSARRVSRMLKGATISGERVRRIARDGRELTLEVHEAGLRDASGRSIGYAGQAIDITERERLSDEQERLAAAMEQTADGVLITDATGIVVFANAAYQRQTGYGYDELIGRDRGELTTRLLGAAVSAEIATAMAAGTKWLAEVDQRRRDGESQRVELALTPFRDASHAVTSYAAVSRDVTHLREMEADLALEAGIRTALAAAVQSLVPDATFQETAEIICERLTTLAWHGEPVVPRPWRWRPIHR